MAVHCNNFESVQHFVPKLGPTKSKRQTVLLIDDDEDQVAFYAVLLRNAGFEVHAVTSPEDAIAAMSRQYFDAVVTDLRMPGDNGFDFIEKLRAIPTVPRSSKPVPIVLLTACSSDLELAALSVGANVFCQKRDARTLLVPQLRQLLGS